MKRGKKSWALRKKIKQAFTAIICEKSFERHPEDGYNFLEKLMEKAKPSAGYVVLAYLLFKTPHNIAITTNFDHLIEDAINYYMQHMPKMIGHESLAHYTTKRVNRATVIKIHRDLLFDPANSVQETEKLDENGKWHWAPFLRNTIRFLLAMRVMIIA